MYTSGKCKGSGKEKKRMLRKVHEYARSFGLYFQTCEGLVKFDTTAGYSYH